jgi:homogentisate 1,2-dioxygenase
MKVDLAGFGNYHQSEAIPGALPRDQNSPQQCQFGLYAEQLSGTAFTRPRHANLRSWLYRMQPSVIRDDFVLHQQQLPMEYALHQAPNPFRWQPLPTPSEHQDFVNGLFPIAGNKVANAFIYQCNQSMEKRYFSSSDGELLFVPYLGTIIIQSEFGKLEISPGQIATVPRGVQFKIVLTSKLSAGYLCENKASPFTLPQLGPIGANGLANPRHFLYPQAAFEEEKEVQLICKYHNQLWVSQSQHSPLNVVAWHGNYAPYSYDLALFNVINTVSFDHPDPSIFTVLTSESNTPGVANLDFVIFPPRWMVAEHTFRPPYYHRNVMSELMGLIEGEYEAKKTGFLPGGVSIHNCMTAHGPDRETYLSVIEDELKPVHYKQTLAFMFETKNPWLISRKALEHPARDLKYSACWQGLPLIFRNPG